MGTRDRVGGPAELVRRLGAPLGAAAAQLTISPPPRPLPEWLKRPTGAGTGDGIACNVMQQPVTGPLPGAT
jgi:hypothetical protein